MTAAEVAMHRRDSRPCNCGHASISHGSYARNGDPVGTGDGPCGFCPCDLLNSTS